METYMTYIQHEHINEQNNNKQPHDNLSVYTVYYILSVHVQAKYTTIYIYIHE